MDEPAEDAKADTDASDVGYDEHYCVEVAFKFVHGLLGLVVSGVVIYRMFCRVGSSILRYTDAV